MSRYYLKIDTGGAECSSYEPRFASYDLILAEGNSLEELLEGAVVFVIDQDGGELGEQEADAEWMQDLIREEFQRKYLTPDSACYDPPTQDRKSDADSARDEYRATKDAEVRSLNRKDY